MCVCVWVACSDRSYTDILSPYTCTHTDNPKHGLTLKAEEGIKLRWVCTQSLNSLAALLCLTYNEGNGDNMKQVLHWSKCRSPCATVLVSVVKSSVEVRPGHRAQIYQSSCTRRWTPRPLGPGWLTIHTNNCLFPPSEMNSDVSLFPPTLLFRLLPFFSTCFMSPFSFLVFLTGRVSPHSLRYLQLMRQNEAHRHHFLCDLPRHKRPLPAPRTADCWAATHKQI